MTSKIKVDNIENQCGGAVVTKCGATTTISGSVVKADDIQAADGGNIINQCGTTITLGASGDTINLAAGASQTGFGRTGTVDWDTTAKTASFTAVSGNGYFVNTTSGAVTVTLPASPSAGNIVSISDYNGTAGTNAITIARNGSNINGNASNYFITKGSTAVTFVYVDATVGWTSVQTSSTADNQNPFITATGGTITECGDFKIHTFTGPGTFCVSSSGSGTPCSPSTVDYLVVAGGGGGGSSSPANSAGGGGGAAGFRESSGAASGCYAVSPLGSGVSGVTLTVQPYPIIVGGGGSGGCGGARGGDGSNSIFSTITSAGGGSGAGTNTPDRAGANGGSGGAGGGRTATCGGCGGAGNTPPVSPPQGQNGGGGTSGGWGGGGGGGAGAAGGTAAPNLCNQGDGGNGVSTSITTSPVAYAGGGGGGGWASPTASSGGSGGGGAGGPLGGSGVAGTTNRGGGGGGGSSSPPATGVGGNGGSGIVIIRYKFQ